MRAYSEDLRKKIVTAIERGMSKAQAVRTFDVSLSSVKRYSRMASQGGTLKPRKSTGGPTTGKPNIVLILTDDQEVSSLVHMPQVKRKLINQGTILTASSPSLCAALVEPRSFVAN